MKANEKEALSELKRVLEERVGVLDLILYGSKARGDDSPDSDIDVMIKVEDYTQEIESAIDDAVFETNLEHDCLVSAVIFSRKELEKGPLGESPLYKRIVEEGIAI